MWTDTIPVCVSWIFFGKNKIVGERKVENRDFKYVIVIAGCSAVSHASCGCAGPQTRLTPALLPTLEQKNFIFNKGSAC